MGGTVGANAQAHLLVTIESVESSVVAGTVVETPLDEFLNTTRPCYAASWEQMVEWATLDETEAEIVHELRAAMRAGEVIDPVLVASDRELCNGRHRVVAAILEKAATISWTNEWTGLSEGYVVEASFEDVGDDPSMSGDDLFDALAGVLRSFKVAPGRAGWVECVGLSGGGEDLVFSYSGVAGQGEALCEAMVERARRVGAELSITSIREVLDVYEDS